MSKSPDLWSKHVQQWQWLGSPLRPAPEDTRTAELCVRQWHDAMRLPAPRALLLGVTPEIARMRWPPGTRLMAIDQNPAMITGVWPGAALGHPGICAEWRSLPLADGTQEVVIGDGCFSTLPYPDGYRALAREIRRVLDEDGMMVFRFSIRPDIPETAAAVFDALRHGRIANFHAFKWRLAMALQVRPEEGVQLSDVHDAWQTAGIEPEALSRKLDWPLPVILTIDAYRGVRARHTFPTLGETRAVMAEYFEETACHFPGYELGERWPTVAFRPR